jgi:hypothetical protein
MACVSAVQSIRRGLEREDSPSNSCTPRSLPLDSATVSKSLPRRLTTRWQRHGSSRSSRRHSHNQGPLQQSIGEMADRRQLHQDHCRSPKSRAGCHFAAAIGLRSMLEDFAGACGLRPDMHTMRARRWARAQALPQRGREAGPAAGRAGPLRGRSLSVVGDQAAKQAVKRPVRPKSRRRTQVAFDTGIVILCSIGTKLSLREGSMTVHTKIPHSDERRGPRVAD